jgi:hypothetical protein
MRLEPSWLPLTAVRRAVLFENDPIDQHRFAAMRII